MQRGADPSKAAGFLGISVEVLLDTYGHHHPEFLREAAAAVTAKPSKNIVSEVDSGVDLAAYRERRRKSLMITWSEWQDLNLRPLRPERSALPG
jgi:hypothetical protein